MQAADESVSVAKSGQQTVALYIGDWDPSGLYMSEVDLPQRLARYGGEQRLKRIALLEPDTDYLPDFDAATKRGDARFRWFVERYGGRCWELDALDPNILRRRVQADIEHHIDRARWQRALVIEAAEVACMTDFHVAWQSRFKGSRQR